MAARSTSASPNRNGFNDKSRMACLSFHFVHEKLQFAWAADRSPYHLECHGRKHKRQRPDVTYDGGCSLALGKSKIRTDMMGGCSLNPVKAHIDVVGIRGRLLAQPSRLLAGAKSSNFFSLGKRKTLTLVGMRPSTVREMGMPKDDFLSERILRMPIIMRAAIRVMQV